ncbi:putative ArsR family transcriptional regulator [Deinobacterium chartae]|uniref:Putative ArsR family transcriptional regulator n=1 Tax=Deinobacterium chartae TaxID=521158 RepID=A0A841I301_9DEIO|nr:metalloregulator ArsR/SmtB family transcription factor [Deinobacterium chartae]MBB6098412.1 putative ArsR family transcriptional regulator [Deinobacterium chartae]
MTTLRAPEAPPLPAPLGLGDGTKSRLLSLLKSRGQATAQELADALGVSIPATRRHLCDLEGAGMLELSIEKPCGRGRPQHVYRLTARGESTFPKSYATLCVDILRHLEELYGSGSVLAVMSARENKLYEAWAPQVSTLPTLRERLERLTALLCEAGYQARMTERALGNGEVTFYLEQGNCPSLSVAREYRQLCSAELELYARLLGAPVVRETQIAAGAASCLYRVG